MAVNPPRNEYVARTYRRQSSPGCMTRILPDHLSSGSSLLRWDPPLRDPCERGVGVWGRGRLDAAEPPARAPALVVGDQEDVRLLVVDDLQELVPQGLRFLPVERRPRATQQLVDPRVRIRAAVVGRAGLEELRGIEPQVEVPSGDHRIELPRHPLVDHRVELDRPRARVNPYLAELALERDQDVLAQDVVGVGR